MTTATDNRLAEIERLVFEGLLPRNVAFGSPTWPTIRKWKLKVHPDCEHCGAAATEVDHVLAKGKGGADRLWNAQSLCHDCHLEKTKVERDWANAEKLAAMDEKARRQREREAYLVEMSRRNIVYEQREHPGLSRRCVKLVRVMKAKQLARVAGQSGPPSQPMPLAVVG